jgi:hypothetical protein
MELDLTLFSERERESWRESLTGDFRETPIVVGHAKSAPATTIRAQTFYWAAVSGLASREAQVGRGEAMSFGRCTAYGIEMHLAAAIRVISRKAEISDGGASLSSLASTMIAFLSSTSLT